MSDVNTVFSVFMQGRGDFSYLADLKPRVVKLMDGKQEEIDLIRSLTPGSFIVNRIYEDDSQVSNDIRNDPEGAAAKHHGMIMERGLTGVDYYQIQNEQHQKPPELELLNRYYMRLMNLCVSSGHRTTVIDCSVGNLHVTETRPGDWEYVFPTLAYAQDNGFVVNCHQYSRESFWNPKTNPETGKQCYPNEWFLHRLEETAMPVLDSYGFNRLLYLVGEFGLSRLLSVCPDEEQKPGGWQIWRTHDEYRQDLINIMSYLLQWSDRILGYTCYLTHAFSPWETHEMFHMNQDLATHYRDNPQQIKPLINGGTPPPIDVIFQARVTANTLNVRSGPSTNFDVVGQVYLNDVVDVTEIVDYPSGSDWWAIRHGNLVGYSSSAYMERIGSGGDLESRVSALEIKVAELDAAVTLNRVDIDKLTTDMVALTSIVRDQDVRIDELDSRVTALEDGGVTPPPTDAILSPGVQHMNLSVVSGGPYVIRDCFTTWHGSWDVSNHIYSITQHARDRYLRQDTGACGGGGDHHIFAAVVDVDGQFVQNMTIIFERTNSSGDTVHHSESHNTRSCGWANLPVEYQAYWRVRVAGNGQRMTPFALPNADGSMPGRHHVSLFTVFQIRG